MKRGPAAVTPDAASEAAEVVLPPINRPVQNLTNLTDALASCKSSVGGIQLGACAGKVDPLGLHGGYERLGADELAVLNADSIGDLEGVSFIQESAKLERVGVTDLGSTASKSQEPIGWEPVDPDLDIMALIEGE